MQEKETKELWKKLRKYPNVVGFEPDLRRKVKDGKELTIEVIRVYVSKKVPLDQFVQCKSILEKVMDFFRRKKKTLSACDLVPSTIDGIPTDVIEIGPVVALDECQQKYRPIKAGISACHKDCTACTISGFFKDPITGKVLLGLNNHCGAQENKALVGDSWIQPGPYDGGLCPQDNIAKLHHFVELKFTSFQCNWRNSLHAVYRWFKNDISLNRVDISFGEIEVPFVIESLHIPNAFCGWRDPELNEEVQKTGRTTGYTKGKVVSLNWIGQVGYSRGNASFSDCILIQGTKFSQGGDSGSPVFDMKGNLIGILFAGSDEYTIICKIGNIINEGKVEVVTNGST
jgi:hypothetical protein